MRTIKDIDAEVVAAWNSGITSSEVGKMFGLTKNSIMGILYRARMKGFQVNEHPKFPRKLMGSKRRKSKMENGSILDQIMPKARIMNVAIYNLDPDGCKFPVSTNSEGHLFCNRKQMNNRSYCEAHCARAYQGMQSTFKRNAQ